MKHNEMDSGMLRELRNNVRHINSFGATQTFDYMHAAYPEDEIKKIRNVILTGCGDSYCAGIAAKPVFENTETFKGTGMAPGTPTEALRNIEFTRYYNTYLGWDPLTVGSYLVCATSVSGNPVRPREALARINELGGHSAAFTNNPSGIFAQTAEHVIDYQMAPSEKNVPNVRSYQASVWSLMVFGLYMSACKGQISWEEADKQRMAALEYANSFKASVIAEIEEHAFDISRRWEEDGVDLMDFIGEGADYATAFFGSAKMVESFGGLTTNDDAEDWNHINYFNRTPSKVGTFIVANTSSPSFSRDLETINVAVDMGRPVVVITDTDQKLFPDDAEVFSLPKPEYKWANPLMEHLPMDFVAAFTGLLREESPYRRYENATSRQSLDVGAARFTKSELVIVK
ncbi:MAG: hypothetical protein ACOX6J_01890 [Oscillospiraceae bacterium]